jgi:hypothetical protein
MDLAYLHIPGMSGITKRQQQIIETIASTYGENVSKEIPFLIAQLMESNEILLEAVQAINTNGQRSKAANTALARAAAVISNMPSP